MLSAWLGAFLFLFPLVETKLGIGVYARGWSFIRCRRAAAAVLARNAEPALGFPALDGDGPVRSVHGGRNSGRSAPAACASGDNQHFIRVSGVLCVQRAARSSRPSSVQRMASVLSPYFHHRRPRGGGETSRFRIDFRRLKALLHRRGRLGDGVAQRGRASQRVGHSNQRGYSSCLLSNRNSGNSHDGGYVYRSAACGLSHGAYTADGQLLLGVAL